MQLRCQGFPPYDWTPLDVSSLPEDGEEQIGTKDKFWVCNDEGTERWLWKQARSKGGTPRGEDWAECLVHVIAQLLGLPSPCVSLATRKDERGVLIRNLLGDGQELEHGNEVLAKHIKGYDSSTKREYPLYTVSNIRYALQEIAGPPPYSSWTAFDVISGYLMLDALVSGCDRHHTNWGIIKTADKSSSILAPTFDHGNALGFTVPENKVQKLLDNEDIEAYS